MPWYPLSNRSAPHVRYPALDSSDADLRLMMDSGVIDRLVNRLVSVFVLGVLTDDRNRNLVPWVA